MLITSHRPAPNIMQYVPQTQGALHPSQLLGARCLLAAPLTLPVLVAFV